MTVHGPNFFWPPPDLIGDEAEYKVEQIRNHHYSRWNRVLQYLIKWKGYPESDNTWELALDIHTSNLICNYHKGTPLKHIKAGWLFIVEPIIPQPGFPSHLLSPQVKPQGFPAQSPPTLSLHHPLVSQVQTWTADPRLLHSCTRTPLLLQGMSLHVPLIGPACMSAALFST